MMRKFLFLLFFCVTAAHAGLSTINPLIPATNAPLQSAPMRGNFAAAYADVNSLIQQNGASTAPAAPVLGQLWLNTTASPYLLNEWDGTAWAPLAAVNTSTHVWDLRGTLNGLSVVPTLAGTSGSIGGSALAAGACASAFVTVTGSTTAMVAVASPVTYPGDGIYWTAYVSVAGTVVVKVCAAIAATPAASLYNVRVVQ